jgi:putative ABC transport system permease protein
VIRPGIRRLFQLPLRRRNHTEQELDEEIRLHLELRAEQLERRGMTPEAARAEARRRFDASDPTHRTLRRVAQRRDSRLRLREWFVDLLRDIRYAGRTLRRSPLFATGVAGTLGLGLAAAMIVFAVAWRIWLAPLSLPDPDGIVRLYEVAPRDASHSSGDARRHQVSPPLLEDLRAHSWRTIESVSAVLTGQNAEWMHARETQNVSVHVLSPDGFGILGIVPVLGRLPSEWQREVLLSERFWRTNFGADPGVIGSEMILGSQPTTIVGVTRLPAGFPGAADIVQTLEWTGDDVAERMRSLRFVDVVARIRPDHSVEEAEAEVDAFIAALAESYPMHRGWSVDAVVLADALTGPFRGVLGLLLAAGATFLLLAGANVAGLVAARRTEGRHERAIRLALGASEGRLLRSSVVESLGLAVVGSIAGVLGAYWLIGPIRALVPSDVPRLEEVALTLPIVLSGITVGAVLGVVVGVAGYLVSRGAEPTTGRAPAWRGTRAGGRRALIVGQVALTTLLTAGGTAVLHRVYTLRAIDLGFRPEGVLTTSTTLSYDRFPSVESRWNVWRSILGGLAAQDLPAAVAFNTPVSGDELPPIGLRRHAASEEVFSELHYVSPGYFSVMGIQLLAGKTFGSTDGTSFAGAVVVSESFVDQYFPPGTSLSEVVGRTIGSGPAARTVLGVVAPTRHDGPDAPVRPDLYVPLSQISLPAASLLVRGEPSRVAQAVSAVATAVEPDLRWTPLVPYTSYLTEWFAPLRLQLVLIGALGALGLLLASLGLYSLLAYQVATRRKELAIRKALGASRERLMWGVVLPGAGTALIGALIGLGAWYPLIPWIRALVEGIEPTTLLIPLSAILVVCGTCVLATLPPAARAARVDPAAALKAD